MPNSEEHMLIGFLAAFSIYAGAKYLQKEEINWGNAVAWGVVGAGVAVLPDILEPAIAPTHRAFAHSVVAGGTVMYATKKMWENDQIKPEEKCAITSLAAAYLSHLAADSLTPAGIPVA